MNPDIIRFKRFNKNLFGYSKKEVDDFLELIARKAEKIASENEKKTIEFQNRIKEYEALDRKLRDAILSMEKNSQEISVKARKKAEEILHQARKQASEINKECEETIIALEREIASLKREEKALIERFEGFLNKSGEIVQEFKLKMEKKEKQRATTKRSKIETGASEVVNIQEEIKEQKRPKDAEIDDSEDEFELKIHKENLFELSIPGETKIIEKNNFVKACSENRKSPDIELALDNGDTNLVKQLSEENFKDEIADIVKNVNNKESGGNDACQVFPQTCFLNTEISNKIDNIFDDIDKIDSDSGKEKQKNNSDGRFSALD